MDARRRLGAAGESLALEHLRSRGYELVEANWRCRYGELDLVMRQGETVVFVEVRTRRGEAAGSPEESLTRAKLERLGSLAQLWLSERCEDGAEPDWRIDVVAVHISSSGRLLEINHLEGIATT